MRKLLLILVFLAGVVQAQSEGPLRLVVMSGPTTRELGDKLCKRLLGASLPVDRVDLTGPEAPAIALVYQGKTLCQLDSIDEVDPAVQVMLVRARRGQALLRLHQANIQRWIGARLAHVVGSSEPLPPPPAYTVDEVFADSPAEKAGLRVGDLILEVDGRPMRGAEDFVLRGPSMRLKVLRQRRQVLDLEIPGEPVPSVESVGLGDPRWDVLMMLALEARLYKKEYQRADQCYRQALASLGDTQDLRRPRTEQALADNLAFLNGLGQDRRPERIALYRSAIAHREALLGPDPYEIFGCLDDLVWLYRSCGQREEAATCARRSQRIQLSHWHNVGFGAASARERLGFELAWLGYLDEAQSEFEAAWALYDDLIAANPSDYDRLASVARRREAMLKNWAFLYGKRGLPEEQKKASDQAAVELYRSYRLAARLAPPGKPSQAEVKASKLYESSSPDIQRLMDRVQIP